MTSEQSFSWYIKRLRVMQPDEVWARVVEQCGLAVLSVRHRLRMTREFVERFDARQYRFCSSSDSLLPSWYEADGGVDEGMAARLLAGGLPEDRWAWRWFPEEVVWHRAPDTGKLWPRKFFGSIAYRAGNPYGDVRYVWEPARLQQLVALGVIAVEGDETDRERAMIQLESQFVSWVKANPPLTGVHYVSAMECGLRLIAVCHAFDLVRRWVRSPEQVWPALLQLVDTHAELIRQRISLHSSVGNHTVAEAAALVYAGLLFPEMAQAGDRLQTGLSLLEAESSHQILPDGGGTEQGLWYLRFVSDLYRLVNNLLVHQGHEVSEGIRRAVTQSCTFLAVMTVSSGRLPSIGDSDNGYALSPLLVPPAPLPERSSRVEFDSSGYSILHEQGGSELRLIFDHGSLGMKPCFAHGHADALSVILESDDEQILIDPGTFTYTGHPAWRAYFRGTSAHNTVVVDGLDQAVQETAFQWSSPYHARLVMRQILAGGETVVIAVHDGYVERTGVLHWRGILVGNSGLWVILDLLTGAGNHTLDLNWHFGNQPRPDTNNFVLAGKHPLLSFTVEGGDQRIFRGSDAPRAGWRSSFYGRKEPIDTLRVSYCGSLPHTFTTCVATEGCGSDTRQSAISLLKGLMHDAQAH